ncbi:MAG: NAD(P)H-hydrate epimerase / ADP-dependent (S)-NAD(P)H-hydrate dehydratase [uncultured Solirubrobacteraceae bacterium]|uniref:Bifunctional NAD(P)H-hydrate repair enzyme n=1 Tax=uncultured Solirubrobacteraceae bacterium TaxID=1162706 RepID=A0A6J4T7L5_9ACTN|nr:MAG: NAD(P)H-hydrate epimerase / ADP-dependent (S)-NAD(P)H-hydrate dehydratase [uncultured Solirubrobacteraceae bacterium]
MSWAPWLEPLPDAGVMRAVDSWAIEQRGIPALVLMDRAGEALARVTAEVVPDGRLAVLCGKGNNGGDGLVAARVLRGAGREVDVLLVGSAGDLSADASAQLQRLPGPPPVAFDPELLRPAAGAIDAMLGTGFSGSVRGATALAIEALDARGIPVVAADVPSGVDASTGRVTGVGVRAAATVAFHAAKLGLWIHPGKALAGEVRVADIGIPTGSPHQAAGGLITDQALADLPSRTAASTKFTSGNVVVIGGSSGLTGAPAMAALAAQRAGAGYVTVAAAASLELAFAARLLEVMFAPLPEDDGHLGTRAVPVALERLKRAGAVVLGPGLGRAESTRAFARELAASIRAPLVVDADGLNALGTDYAEVLGERETTTILTPHAGELGRLLGVPSATIDGARLDHAREAARLAGAIVVLKGDDTLVALPDGRVAVSAGGAPGLATAGTGDVLAGVIAALLARGATPGLAACAGVHAHVRAGRRAGDERGPDHVIASDVIRALPAAMRP